MNKITTLLYIIFTAACLLFIFIFNSYNQTTLNVNYLIGADHLSASQIAGVALVLGFLLGILFSLISRVSSRAVKR